MQDENALRRAVAMIEPYLDENTDARTPVVRHLTARELRKQFDVSLDGRGVALEELPAILAACLHHSVRSSHPQFLNQLYGGFSTAGFLGDMWASLLNTSMYTFEVAPLFTLMELELIRKLNAFVGLEGGEGIFCTGGSNANMLGVLCARNRAFPDCKARGFRSGKRPVMFVSDQAHYSFLKAANLLGVGLENVTAVATDAGGRMIPSELDVAIRTAAQRGALPFFVGATAGTTVLGAVDPLADVAAICRQHGVWMHVDGAWGGPILLSQKHRHLLKGVELCDSCAWDAHKMMGATLTCSVFLTKHPGTLARTCGTDAAQTGYLFHETEDSALDLGQMSLQCGRRIDPLRLWLLWKHHGDDGLAARVDHLFDLAGLAEEQVESRPDLEAMAPVQTLNVCFRHRPDRDCDLNAVNLELRERLRKSGKSFVNYAHVRGDVALRLVLANPSMREADVVRFFDNLAEVAQELSAHPS